MGFPAQGLPIVIDKNTKVLIVGTFPSYKSRTNKYYYANKDKNRFWQIITSIYPDIHEPFNENEFQNITKPQLLKHKIGLWDLIKTCKLKKNDGSGDKNIINETIVFNDLSKYPKSSKIIYLCNGKKAYEKIKNRFNDVTIEHCESTSRANADDFAVDYEYLPEFRGLKRNDESITKYWKIKLNKLLGEK